MGMHPQACPAHRYANRPVRAPGSPAGQVVILAQASVAHDLMSTLCGGSREPRQRLKIETDADLERIQNIWTELQS
jgi:hypothetical protein